MCFPWTEYSSAWIYSSCLSQMKNNPTAWQKIRTSFMLVWAGALHSGQFVLNCSTWNTTWRCRMSSPREMSPVRLKTFRWYVGGGKEESHWTSISLRPQLCSFLQRSQVDSLHFWDRPLLASFLVLLPKAAEKQITCWHIYLSLPNTLPWSKRKSSGLLLLSATSWV